MNRRPAKRLGHVNVLGEIVEIQDFVVGNAQHVGCGLVNAWFGFARTDGEGLDNGCEILESQVLLHLGTKFGEGIRQKPGLESVVLQFGDLVNHWTDHRVLTRRHQGIDFVTVQLDVMLAGPWFQGILNISDGDFAPFGSMPRMITTFMRPEHDGQHRWDIGDVAFCKFAELVGDRSNQHPAEVENYGLN